VAREAVAEAEIHQRHDTSTAPSGSLRQLAKTEKTAFVRTGDNTSAYRFLKSDLDAYIAAPRVPAAGAASASRGKKGAK